MANNKEPYILLTFYANLYFEKYGKKVLLNKYREKYAMQDVIESIGFDKTKDLLSYYFNLKKQGHPLQFFYYNFDKMESSRVELKKDIESRHLILQATKKMVEEDGR